MQEMEMSMTERSSMWCSSNLDKLHEIAVEQCWFSSGIGNYFVWREEQGRKEAPMTEAANDLLWLNGFVLLHPCKKRF